MTTDAERLRTSLKRLGLHTVADIFEREAQKAAKAKQSYVGFLAHLIDEELAAKADRSINARIARARFPAIRTLEAFDFAFQPSIPAALIRELAELGFLERAENLLLVGPPGVGKSHVGIAIGLRACAAHKRVLFRAVPDLLDELGYLPMDARRANLFFQLVSRRYEHGSVIVTSNKPFEEWGAIFGDDVIAAAVLDRLLHHSHIIPITGASYRTKDKQIAKREGR